MTYALDPRIHRVWRTPHILQFGVDQPLLTLVGLSNAEERMLVALDTGVTLSGLRMVARQAGGHSQEADGLLRRLRCVLARSEPHPPTPSVLLDGRGPTATRLAQVLRESEIEVVTSATQKKSVDPPVRAAIIVASFAIEPERHRRLLRRDVPHLAVVFGDRRARIGPLVEPGDGPCLGCLDRRRAEQNPHWTAMATQLAVRDSGAETSIVSASAAVIAARTVLTRLRTGSSALRDRSLLVDYADGAVTEQTHRPHAGCGCRALPGTGKADAAPSGRPDSPAATSSAEAGGAPA